MPIWQRSEWYKDWWAFGMMVLFFTLAFAVFVKETVRLVLRGDP